MCFVRNTFETHCMYRMYSTQDTESPPSLVCPPYALAARLSSFVVDGVHGGSAGSRHLFHLSSFTYTVLCCSAQTHKHTQTQLFTSDCVVACATPLCRLNGEYVVGMALPGPSRTRGKNIHQRNIRHIRQKARRRERHSYTQTNARLSRFLPIGPVFFFCSESTYRCIFAKDSPWTGHAFCRRWCVLRWARSIYFFRVAMSHNLFIRKWGINKSIIEYTQTI